MTGITSNGTYKCKHKFLHHTDTITYSKGFLRTSLGNTLIRTSFVDFWEVLEKVKATPGMYNIVWRCGAREETVSTRLPYPVALNKISELKRTTHKSGELKLVKST